MDKDLIVGEMYNEGTEGLQVPQEEMELCPGCFEYKLHKDDSNNAISRMDNKTVICKECAVNEALLEVFLEIHKVDSKETMLECPRCKKTKLHANDAYNALSRKDNKTYVCSDCGVDEALVEALINIYGRQK